MVRASYPLPSLLQTNNYTNRRMFLLTVLCVPLAIIVVLLCCVLMCVQVVEKNVLYG